MSTDRVVYCITHRATGKEYVGVTTRGAHRRFQDHLKAAKQRQKEGRRLTEFHIDLLSYGSASFSIANLATLPEEEAFAVEAQEVACRQATGSCYNIRPGGKHAPMAEASKALLRGRTISEATRTKIAAARSGFIPNERQRAALNRGRPFGYKGLAGSKNGRDKLTIEQVEAIRSATGSQQAIANRYGVSQPLVSKIKRGVVWKGEY